MSFCRHERSAVENIPNPLPDAKDRDPTPGAFVSRADSVAGKSLVEQKASNGLFCEALCDQRALQMGSGKREVSIRCRRSIGPNTVTAARAQAGDLCRGAFDGVTIGEEAGPVGPRLLSFERPL